MAPSLVLYLHATAGGYGADRQLETIVAGLDRSRYRPLVVLSEAGELRARLEAHGAEVVLAPLAVLRRDLLRGVGLLSAARLALQNAREIGDLGRSRGVALVHSNTSLVLAGRAVARRAGVRHVQHVREIYQGVGGAIGRSAWPWYGSLLASSDAVVCVSRAAAVPFAGARSLSVIRDAVPRFSSLPPRLVARAALGVPEDAFAIAVVGRVSDWKGQSVLLRALAEPSLRALAPVVLVCGDAAPGQRRFREELEHLREELGLGDQVRLLGHRDDVETVLAAADVFASPSTHADALPNAVLEAGRAALPVVATRVGGLTEIVEDGRTGMLVPPSDPAALAAALAELAADPERRDGLGRALEAAIEERFGAGRMLAEVQDVYDELLRPRRRTAWLLPAKRLPIAAPVATDLRAARLERWLGELGFDVVRFVPPTLRSTASLAARALREQPSLVVSQGAIHGPALAAMRRLLGSRTTIVTDVMGLHSLEVDQAFADDRLRPLARAVWRFLERLWLRAAHLVLAVNERHASVVRTRDRGARVAVFRDGAEADLVEIRPAARAALGLREDGLAIGFVGSIVYGRLDPLFEAWPMLAGRNACLLVVGEGPDLERYRARAEAAGWLGRSMFFAGGLPRHEAIAALRTCDVAYSDCWSEAGFPAKLFEAMALGLPIVTVDEPQIAEVLTDGESALLHRTPAELAEHLVRLAADPALRGRLGEGARRALLRGHTLADRRRELGFLLGGEPRPAVARPERPRLVSVVLPVLDAEEHLGAQLAALAAQTYRGEWELVVVDDGCRDASLAIVESWRERLPSVRVLDATERPGLNRARNRGARAARGDFLAFCDADDVVDRDWLDALVEAAPRADLVAGKIDEESLNPPSVRAWRPPGPAVALEVRHGFLPAVPGGNCGVWTRVARAIGWDESFRYGSSDLEFAWCAQIAGHEVVAAPRAVVATRHRGTMAATAAQYFRYGTSEPRLYRRFRRAGMRAPGLFGAAHALGWLIRRLPPALITPEARGHWLRRAALGAGQLLGSLRQGVFFVGEVPARSGPHLLEFGVRWPPETFVARRLERLAAAGFRVSVASLDDGHEGDAPLAGVDHYALWRPDRALPVMVASAIRHLSAIALRSPARASAIAWAALAPTATGRTVGLREAIARVATYARAARLAPDLLHVEWCNVAANFPSLPGALERPFSLSCHGSDLLVRPHVPTGRATSRALPEVLRRAERIHCAAEALAEAAVRLGAKPEKVRVVRAAVDPILFRPPPVPRAAGARFRLVAVGTLGWVKGFEYLVLSVAELARTGTPVEVDLVGGDPERDTGEATERVRIETAIADLGLEGKVRLHGHLPTAAVRDRLQSADAYVQSSLSEGHPTALVEAMACGLPIVATDCGGTREAMDDGVEGFLVAPRDWRAAARALERLWNDPALRERMGGAARARVEREFTLERQTERFAALYGEMLAR